jgi:hypothetical protein
LATDVSKSQHGNTTQLRGRTQGVLISAWGSHGKFGVTRFITRFRDWPNRKTYPHIAPQLFQSHRPGLLHRTPQNRHFWNNSNDRIILAVFTKSVNWDKWIKHKYCKI